MQASIEFFRSSDQQHATAALHLSYFIKYFLALFAVEGDMTKDSSLQYARSRKTFAKGVRVLSAQRPNNCFIPRKCPFAALFESSLQEQRYQWCRERGKLQRWVPVRALGIPCAVY